jgi:predicted Zn-dependent protease
MVALVFAGLCHPAFAQGLEDPELFQKSQMAAQQALSFYGGYDDSAEMRRVANIGYRIAQESKFQDFPFTFYLADMPAPNAFALPGGQIFLTSGMLKMGLSDDMLAGLLGHEIGHVVLQHGTRLQRKATLLNILSQALLVGVLIGVASSGGQSDGVYDPYGRSSNTKGDLIQGTAAAGAVISELLMRSYSREFEDEADDEGQRLAAAAGFDPDGTRQLMDKMRTHLPQSKEYGYWRTHPFFEDRVRAATARESLLKIQQASTADQYRAQTQSTLLDFLEYPKLNEDLVPLLKHEALVAWPQGSTADQIRLEQLHLLRDREQERKLLSQEWREVATVYQKHLDEVRSLTPDSPLIGTLETELAGLESQLDEIYPQAAGVLENGIYETEFLETFASNFPDKKEIAEVALALGIAYARLGREDDAVEYFLRTMAESPGSAAGQQALTGLRNLTPRINSLAALEQLATESSDQELRKASEARLAKLASEYEALENGAEYLRRFPDGDHSIPVSNRLNQLADELYAELVLYQSVGDHVKGIDRIQRILTFAPHSPAADRLREQLVLES